MSSSRSVTHTQHSLRPTCLLCDHNYRKNIVLKSWLMCDILKVSTWNHYHFFCYQVAANSIQNIINAIHLYLFRVRYISHFLNIACHIYWPVSFDNLWSHVVRSAHNLQEFKQQSKPQQCSTNCLYYKASVWLHKCN